MFTCGCDVGAFLEISKRLTNTQYVSFPAVVFASNPGARSITPRPGVASQHGGKIWARDGKIMIDDWPKMTDFTAQNDRNRPKSRHIAWILLFLAIDPQNIRNG